MKFYPRWPHLFILFIPLILASCGDKGAPNADLSNHNESLTPPGASKELGLQCLREGDLACAKANYCAIHADAPAALRCCLAGFLATYFSENTQALARMLGYQPVNFNEIRGMTRDELLETKALPFGELFLLPHEKAPLLKDLLRQWGAQLANDQASSSELMERIGRLGFSVEGTVSCLDQSLGGFRADAVEPVIFQSDRALQVAPRDLLFIRFVLGTLVYATQAVSPYDLGAENFPTWPPDDGFLEDVNGWDGEGDARFGELVDDEVVRIAGLHPHLIQAFEALWRFSSLKDSPSKVDAYLIWRYNAEFQEKASAFLKVAYASLQSGDWQKLPQDTYQIRLSALAKAVGVPDSRGIPVELPFLIRGAEGDVEINGEYLKLWADPVVRLNPERKSGEIKAE